LLVLFASCARPAAKTLVPIPQTATTTTTATATTTTTTTAPALFAPAAAGIALVYTASVQGYVEPCGCTGDPLGGIARFKAVIDEARQAFGERVVVVDGGDLLFEKVTDNGAVDRCQAEARTELLVSTYARAGLVATTRGPLDDVRGLPFRAALLQRHKVPSLEHGQSIVVTRGGHPLLIVGVDDQDEPAVVDAAIKRALGSELRAPQAVIVLAQMSFKDAVARARQWQGVDVVIVGRAAEAPVAPQQVGGAVVVSAGWQAQYAGVITLHLDGRAPGAPLALEDKASIEGRKKLLDVRLLELDRLLASLPAGPQKDFQAQRRATFAKERASLDAGGGDVVSGPRIVVQALPLKRGMNEEAQAQRELAFYEGSIPALVGQCEQGVSCPEPPAGQAVFVGAATCKACHAVAYDTWQKALVDVVGTNKDGSKSTHKSGHAVAWPTLLTAGRDKDRSCVACHSAGFDVVGGACTTTALTEKQLTGVQCEACHGPGSLHVNAGGDVSKIRRVVDEGTCRGCHQPPHIETAASFVYEERLQKILGPGHQRRVLP
jgi:hypothetical protein